MIQLLTQHLKNKTHMRVFKKGATLLFQGEIPRHAFIIHSGVVRAYSVKTSGEESIVSLFTKGDIFPLPWLIGTTSNSLFYYEAVDDVRVTCVAKQDFHDVLAKNPQLMNDLLRFVATQYTSLLVRITGLSQSRAIEKISFTFYYLLFRHGVPGDNDVYKINLKLNHAMVASLTGLTRESTTTNLGILKEKGIIDYNRTSFSVNKRRLESFIGEDGFRELQL